MRNKKPSQKLKAIAKDLTYKKSKSKKTHKKRKGTQKDYKDKMVAANLHMAIITLDANTMNSSIKSRELGEGKCVRRSNSIFCLPGTHSSSKIKHRIKANN